MINHNHHIVVEIDTMHRVASVVRPSLFVILVSDNKCFIVDKNSETMVDMVW